MGVRTSNDTIVTGTVLRTLTRIRDIARIDFVCYARRTVRFHSFTVSSTYDHKWNQHPSNSRSKLEGKHRLVLKRERRAARLSYRNISQFGRWHASKWRCEWMRIGRTVNKTHFGYPVTTLLCFNQLFSHFMWQLQTNGFDKRSLQIFKSRTNDREVTTKRSYSADKARKRSNEPGAMHLIRLSCRDKVFNASISKKVSFLM